MWSYYGAKTNVVKYYPPPRYGTIIEPFAGSARYALEHWEHNVILMDKYEIITRIWRWLQQCSRKDVLALPRRMLVGENLNKYTFDCEEARWLMGFLVGYGLEAPRQTATAKQIDRPNYINFSLERIAANLHKIHHWTVLDGSYEQIPNQEATWFIDPPYQYGGECYPASSKNIDFSRLAAWCMEREGQAIVCETTKADWMPFIPLRTHKTRRGLQSEAFWTNLPTSYSAIQAGLW